MHCAQFIRELSETEAWALSEPTISSLAKNMLVTIQRASSYCANRENYLSIIRQHYVDIRSRTSQTATHLNQVHAWQLTEYELEELVTAVLPYTLTSPKCITSDETIEIIVANYYAEGPMVQTMLAADSPARESLWTAWRVYLLNLADTKGIAAEDAEELVQEVCVKAQLKLAQFRHESKLAAYFFKIFTNQSNEWFRKLHQQNRYELLLLAGANDGAREMSDQRTGWGEVSIDSIYLVEIADYVAAEIIKLTSTEDFEILYLAYVEQFYVETETKAVVKWTDEVLARRYAMTLNGLTAKRLRAEQKIIRFIFERLGNETVVDLIGHPAIDILQLYYVEQRYRRPADKQWQSWTNEAIAAQLNLTAQCVKEKRLAAVKAVVFEYARRLLQGEHL